MARGRTLRNILVAGGAVALTTILATVGTSVYYVNIHQPAKERRILTIESQIPMEVIKQYEAQGVWRERIKVLHRKKVTPEIVSKLKERESLSPSDVFELAISGYVPNRPIVFNKRNFDGAEYQRWVSNGLNLELMAESTNRNLTLEQTLAGIAAGFPVERSGPNAYGFLRLADHHIPLGDAVPLKQKGYTIDRMVKEYADAVGVSPEDRRDYLRMGFNDPEIKIFAAKNLRAKIIGTLMGRTDIFGGFRIDEPPLNKGYIIKLVKTGKLSGEINDKWDAAGFRKEEFKFALRRGYNLNQAILWRDAGFSVKAMGEFEIAGIKLEEAIKYEKAAKILRRYHPRF